jgi:hypothetical protein
MSSVVIAGNTSGTVTLSAPAVSGTTTLTLPATSGTLLQSGTAVTVAQGGTGLTTVGTSGNLLTSNGTAWTSTAPAASGPVIKYVTDATDITLVDIASSQVNVGTSFSVSIPTTGYINLTSYAGRLTWSSGNYPSIVWGIRISSTNYWFGKWNQNGTIAYGGIISANTSAGFDEFYGSVEKWTNISTTQYGTPSLGLDITANSVPTGTQTVQLIAAYGALGNTGIGILKGTTTTTRVGLQFSSAS